MSNYQIVKATEFRQYLGANMRAIEASIRTKMKPETVCTMLMAQRSDPSLAACTPESFLRAGLQSLQLGLEPNNSLGHAYLVPYKGQCTLQIGYKGMIQLAYRSGRIKSIHARCVYANEDWELDWANTPPIRHRPKPPSARGEFIAAYCIIETTTGGKIYDWMWDEEIEVIRNGSPAKERGPWKTRTDEMRRKTVVKRGLKYSPCEPDSEMSRAVAIDDRMEAGVTADLEVIDVTPFGDKPPSGPMSLDDLIDEAPAIPAMANEAPKPEPPPETKPLPEKEKLLTKASGKKNGQGRQKAEAGAVCPRCNEPGGKHVANCPNDQTPPDEPVEFQQTVLPLKPATVVVKNGDPASEVPPINESAVKAHAAATGDKLRLRRLTDVRNLWAKLAKDRRDKLLEELGLEDPAEIALLEVSLLGRFLDLLHSALRQQQEEAELG